jgi:hypothetical protein
MKWPSLWGITRIIQGSSQTPATEAPETREALELVFFAFSVERDREDLLMIVLVLDFRLNLLEAGFCLPAGLVAAEKVT